MLQPKYAKQLDSNIKELIANGGSNEDIDKMASDYTSLFSDEALKKKGNSQPTAPTPNLDSGTNTSSSGLPKFKSDVQSVVDNTAPTNFSKTKPVVKDRGFTSNVNPIENIEVANNAFNYAKQNISKEKSLQRLNDEVDNNQFFDQAFRAVKQAYNTTVAPALTVANNALGGDKNFFASEYKPLETEIKQIKDAHLKEFGKGSVLPKEQLLQRARDLFVEKDQKQQMYQLIDKALPVGYDREGIWRDLNLTALRSNDKLRSRVASAEVFNKQIEEFDSFAKKLTPQERKSGLSQEKLDKYNNLRQNALEATDNLNYLSKDFKNILKEAETDAEKLDLFKYNYNDWQKTGNALLSGAKNIVFGASKMLSETVSYIGDKTGQVPLKIGADLISDVSSEVMNEDDTNSKQYLRYKASSINNFSDLGSFGAQLFSEQAPILGSMVLGGGLGLATVSLSSGGGKINELEEQAKQPFGKIYSQGEKVLAGLLYSGAEVGFEFLGTARILKDLERTLSSASKVGRREFMSSYGKETLKSLGRTAYYAPLEATTEYLTTESQITIDEELLGIVETDFVNNEKRKESAISGGLMGVGMQVVGGAIGFGVEQAKLYSDRKDIKAVKDIFAKINEKTLEIQNNPNLTEAEVIELYKENNVLNNLAFDIVDRNAKKGSDLSIEAKSFLVDTNRRQTELKETLKEVKDSNFSEAIKVSKIEDLKTEFDALEKKRSDTLQGDFNVLMTLPSREVTALKNTAQRELTKEKSVEIGKSFTLNDTEITQRAIEIYKREQNKIQETPTNETQTPTKEQANQAQPQAEVKTEVVEVKPIENEATPTNANPTNGEITPTNNLVEQNGVAKPEVVGAENVQEADNSGAVEKEIKPISLQEEVKPEVNFDDIASFLNKNFISKPDEQARPNPEPISETNKRADEKGNGENPTTPKKPKAEAKPKYLKVSHKGKTPLAKRRFKGDRKTATNIEPKDALGLVLRYFIDGGKISKEAVLKLYKGSENEFKARTKIGGYAFINVFDKNGNIQSFDDLVHTIWENKGDLKLDTSQIKDALENVVGSHNRINNMINSYLKNNNEETQNNPEEAQLEYEAKFEFQEEFKVNEEEMQEVESILDNLTDEEIIRLAENEKMAYVDFLADLDKRAVTYDLGPFSETGFIQNDGSIISDVNGSILSPQSVSNVQFVNKPKIESKPKNDVEQQKEIINEQVDKLVEKIKKALPKGGDGSENIQGIDQDQLIDMVANAVKALVSKGIDINEAIKQVIQSIKDKFNLDVDVEAVKNKLFPKEEKVEEKKEENNQPNTSKFAQMADQVPNTSEVRNYLSGDTIEKYTSEKPENNQEYLAIRLTEALTHGVETINEAKRIFGDNLVKEVLNHINNTNLSSDKKALLYVSLENELDRQIKAEEGDRLTIKKQLKLIREKSQLHARQSSIAINYGRLRSFAKLSYDLNNVTNGMFTSTEKVVRNKIEKAVQASMDDIQAEAERQEQEQEDDIQDYGFSITPPKAKRNVTVVKNELNNVFKDLKKDLQKSFRDGTLSATIPYAKQLIVATPHIAKAAKLMIEIGGYTAKDIVNAIYDSIINEFPLLTKKDIVNVISENQQKEASKAKKSEDKQVEDKLKQELIEAGYFREITITKNIVDENGKNQKVKEKRKIFDWKKLAGEEGSVENIRKIVQENLSNKGYSKTQINDFIQSLEEGFNNLRASIIEKSANELQVRNTPRNIIDIKANAKRMAELYNYGAFESDTEQYDNIMNSLLGLSDFEQVTFNKLKAKAKVLSDLYASAFDPYSIKTEIDKVQKDINEILYKYNLKKGGTKFTLANLLKEYMDFSTRMVLHSIGQVIQNPVSGIVQRGILKASNIGSGTDTKALLKQRSKLAWSVFNDITTNGGMTYGNVESSLVGQGRTENRLNAVTDNKVYHSIISATIGRLHLDAADSFNKVIIAKKKFELNLISILTSPTNPNGTMTKKEATRYVSETLTGQSFDDAMVKAENLINEINSKNPDNKLPINKQSVVRLADAIVREALVLGGKLNQKEVEASFNAGYKSAGYDIGHESNNILSSQIKLHAQKIDEDLKKAVKEKNYDYATILTFYKAFYSNFITTFVGGGTNWVVITAQNAGIDVISPIFDNLNAKSNKLDLSTLEGLKNLENALMRKQNARSVNSRLLIGGVSQLAIILGIIGLGVDDDIEEYLDKNPQLKKYFYYIAPTPLAIWLAYQSGSKDFVEKIQKVVGVRSPYFDQTYQLSLGVQGLYNGYTKNSQKTIDKASGTIGKVVGAKFNVPLPWRTVRDIQNIYRGLEGLPPIKADYKAKGFWDGTLTGGFVDFINLKPNYKNTVSKSQSSGNSY